jgi:hypothetical protein
MNKIKNKITQKELYMLLLLGRIINDDNPTLDEKELGVNIFWIWNNHIYKKYGISMKNNYIEKDGEIKTRNKDELIN